jgi:PAS domain S-box-containing protein
MNTPTYTVLIVEDFLADRELYCRALQKDTTYDYRFLEAESVAQGLSLCSSTSIDVVLLDYLLPDADGLEFLTTLAVQCNGNRPPVVMMTGQGNESIAVQAMKLGVQDYLVKGNLTPELLRLAVRNAIDNSRLKRQLQVANQRTIEIWESMTDAYVTVDRDWRVIYANQAATQVICHLTNLAPAEFLGRSHWDLFPALLGGDIEREYRRALDERVTLHLEIWFEPTASWFEAHLYPAAEGLGIYFRDITDRKCEEAVLQQAEATIRQQLEEIETIYRNAPIGMCFVNTDLRYMRINPLLAQINGASVSAHLGHTFREVLPELADRVEPLYRQVIESGEAIIDLEVSGTNQAQPGVERHWLTSFYPQTDEAGRVIGVNNVVHEITDRKRLELDRLEAQQERDRFFDLSLDLLAIANFDGYFLRLNPAWEQTLGFTNAELMAQPYLDLVHPDDLAATLAAAAGLSAGQMAIRFENRYRCKDGSYRWLSWSSRPYDDRDLVYAVAHDITEQKRDEELLRQSEELTRRILDSSRDCIKVVDLAGRLIYMNDYGQSLMEIDDFNTVASRQWLEFWQGSERELAQTAFSIALAGGVDRFDGYCATAKGTPKWWEVVVTPILAADGRVSQILSVSRDITDRKQAETALQIGEELFRSTFENTSIGLAHVALDGTWMRVNQKICDILGYDSAELLATTFQAITEPADLAEDLDLVQQLVNGEINEYTLEKRYIHRQGHHIWANLTVALIRTIATDGQIGIPQYFISAIQDITDRKQLEAQLVQRESQLQLFVKYVPAGVAMFDRDMRYIIASDRWIDNYARVDRDIMGRSLYDVFPNLPQQWKEIHQRCLAGAIESCREDRFPHVDGSFDWIRWEVRPWYTDTDTDEIGGIIIFSEVITDHKLQSVALFQSERKFSAIFNQTFQLMGLVSLDGVLLEVNQAALNSIGSQQSEIVGKSFWDAPWWHTEQLQQQLKAAIATAASGQFVRYEVEFPNPSGGTTITDFSLKPMFDEVGGVESIVAEANDITDRKHAERELKESEERLQTGISVAGVGLARFDYTTNLVELSPEAASLYGFSADTTFVTREQIHNTFHPDERTALEETIAHVINPHGKGWFAQDHRVVWPSGEVRCLSVRKQVFFDRSGAVARPSYGILAAIDISLRKRAERDLRESQERLRAGIEVAGVGLARFDYTTNLVALSPEAASLYGFSADTTFVTRKQIHDTFHPDERTALEATIAQVINPDGTGWFAQDHRVVWPSGEVRCLSVRKQVFFDRSGAVARPSYAVLAAIDVTDRNQTLAALEARNQELDSFVYVVSHDLKAPLRAVANLSEWIEEDLAGALTDANQEQMTLLRSRVYKMQSTIDGLLDYARSGRTDCINEPVDVAQLLAETIDSISPPPTFTISIAQNLPTLDTKRLLLSQVFTNLIGNGIKHHDRVDGSIHIAAAECGNFYEFAIADDGPGIALEHQDRMFKIFQAVNPQNRSDSTGIGLAIVKKIIEAEGGTIRLESLVGKGTTFYFTWPMALK